MTIDQRWKDTVKQGINDAKWDQYDSIIKSEVDAYAHKFKALVSKIDWLLLKALLWTESGGPDNSAWNTRPMQIGNKGDPGYSILKNEGEGSSLIMSDELKQSIANGFINTPDVNIKAGMAYLYTRMAITNIMSIRNLKDSKEYGYEIVSGDNLEKISIKISTTIFELRRLNPAASGIIRPGQKMKYVKATMQRSIIDWRKFNADNIADRYNGGGDKDYSSKITYILNEIFPKLVRAKQP